VPQVNSTTLEDASVNGPLLGAFTVVPLMVILRIDEGTVMVNAPVEPMVHDVLVVDPFKATVPSPSDISEDTFTV
jgi:hypothetical protein